MSNEKQLARIEATKKIVEQMESRINDLGDKEAKEDLRIIITSLVGFFAQENPKMFEPGKSEEYVIKEFFKTLVNVGTDYMIPWKAKANQEKMEKFMVMLPVIKKYYNNVE